MTMFVGCRRILLSVALAALVPSRRAQDIVAPAATMEDVCAHEQADNVASSIEIKDGDTVYRDIRANQTHRYFHRNFNVTTMNQPDQYRKLIVNLEPCRGIVYLFVRKTRRCYPNPYSCIDLAPGGFGRLPPEECKWTHFMSVIDGSRDGTPTLYEVPLSSTKYFISVFAATNAAYTLTLLADIGAFPRPGNNGRITARQLRELQVQISWEEAYYMPPGITSTKQYWVYSALLLENDNRTNMAVFMRPDKIMNTVCGLKNNTDRHYDRVPAGAIATRAGCQNGICNATIDGVITDQRYVFNIVAESYRGHMMAYGGLVMRTDWEEVRQVWSDKTLNVLGTVSACILAMVVNVYFLMLKMYG